MEGDAGDGRRIEGRRGGTMKGRGRNGEGRRNGTRHEGAFSRQGVNSAALRLPLSASSSCARQHESTSFHLIKTPDPASVQQPDSLTIPSPSLPAASSPRCSLFRLVSADASLRLRSSSSLFHVPLRLHTRRPLYVPMYPGQHLLFNDLPALERLSGDAPPGTAPCLSSSSA